MTIECKPLAEHHMRGAECARIDAQLLQLGQAAVEQFVDPRFCGVGKIFVYRVPDHDRIARVLETAVPHLYAHWGRRVGPHHARWSTSKGERNRVALIGKIQ